MLTRTGFMYQTVHSMGMSGSTARQRLLDAAIEYTAEHGISDLSLRSLAAAPGTSHRMLIFHFGSREGLWGARVVEALLRPATRKRPTRRWTSSSP